MYALHSRISVREPITIRKELKEKIWIKRHRQLLFSSLCKLYVFHVGSNGCMVNSHLVTNGTNLCVLLASKRTIQLLLLLEWKYQRLTPSLAEEYTQTHVLLLLNIFSYTTYTFWWSLQANLGFATCYKHNIVCGLCLHVEKRMHSNNLFTRTTSLKRVMYTALLLTTRSTLAITSDQWSGNKRKNNIARNSRVHS